MRRAYRRRLLGVLSAAVLVGVLATAAGAAPSASYADPAGDGNEAPISRSVTVDDATPGVVNIRVTVSNFQELPADSRITLHFDLDRNATTGVGGDELVIRYWDDETLEVVRWNGIAMYPSSSEGVRVSSSLGELGARRRPGRARRLDRVLPARALGADPAGSHRATDLDRLRARQRSDRLRVPGQIVSHRPPGRPRRRSRHHFRLGVRHGSADRPGAGCDAELPGVAAGQDHRGRLRPRGKALAGGRRVRRDRTVQASSRSTARRTGSWLRPSCRTPPPAFTRTVCSLSRCIGVSWTAQRLLGSGC